MSDSSETPVASRRRARNGPARGAKAKRLFYSYARLVHIYLSMSLFALMLLFCVTGILLNHVDWLEGSATDGEAVIELPDALRSRLTAGDVFSEPPLNELQGLLREQVNLEKPSGINLDEAAGEIILDYQLPAGYATAIVDVATPELFVMYRRGGAMSIMNDLHKGRHTGDGWSWVIDLSAGLMILFSITGMAILFQNRRHRRPALIVSVLGVLTPLAVYWFWVPRLAGV
jgi:hypothetical protein